MTLLCERNKQTTYTRSYSEAETRDWSILLRSNTLLLSRTIVHRVLQISATPSLQEGCGSAPDRLFLSRTCER